MNYEKKYKEALERARALKNGEDVDVEAGTTTCEYIFPELKESEDEKVRKTLTRVLNENIGNGIEKYGAKLEDALAWLEKQKSVGEIVERCKTSWYNEGKIAGMAEGLTDEEKYQQGWHDALEKQGEPKVSVDDFKAKDWYVSKVDGKIRNIYHSVDMVEPKDYSSIDPHFFKPTVIDEGKAEMDYCFTKMMNDGKVSPVWGEEDNDFMYDTLSNLTELKDRYGEGYGNVGKCIDWLKSLKQRIGG